MIGTVAPRTAWRPNLSRPGTPREFRTGAASDPVRWLVPAALLAALAFVAALVTGSSPLLAAGAAAGVIVLGLALVVWPDVATITMLVLVYSNAAVVGAQVHGLPYTFAALVPALLVVPLLNRVVLRREPLVIPPTLPFVVAFLLVEVISTLVSRDPAAASAELTRVLGEGVLLYVLVVNTVRTLPVLRAVIVALVVTGALLAALTVLQEASGSLGNTYLGFAQVQGGFATGTFDQLQPRAAGPIGEKNFYAQMLLALIPLVLILGGTARARFRPLVAGAGLLIAAGVALTFSRGAFVGAVLLLPAMLALRMIGVRGIAAVVAAGLLVVVLVPNYLVRLTSLEGIGGALSPSAATDPVIAQRANDVLAASLVFVDHPIVGVGPGLFPSYYREYATKVAGLPGNLDYAAHSLYAEVASETGGLGLLTFGGLIGATVLGLLRARRRALAAERRDLVVLANGFVLVVVAYLGTGLALHISYQRYIWMFLALSAAAIMVIRSELTAAGPAVAENAGTNAGAGAQRAVRAQAARAPRHARVVV